MFDDYVLYLVESLQSHDRYNELLASVCGDVSTQCLNNNTSSSNSNSNCGINRHSHAITTRQYTHLLTAVARQMLCLPRAAKERPVT